MDGEKARKLEELASKLSDLENQYAEWDDSGMLTVCQNHFESRLAELENGDDD